MTGDFVYLTPFVRHFSIGESEREMDRNGKRRLEQFVRSVSEDVRVIVLSDKCGGCADGMAYTREHYDYATVNPARILVRKEVAEAAGDVDFVALCRIFLKEEKFGVFERYPEGHGETMHPYTKRREGTYGTSPEEYREVLALVQKKYGEVLPFYQNLIIQDLFHLFHVLGEKDALVLKGILEYIDDDIILGCGCISEDILIRILSLKHGSEIEKELVYRGGKLRYHNLPVLPLKEIPFVADKISIIKGKFNIEGSVQLPLLNGEMEYFYMDNKNKRHDVAFEEGEEVTFLGERLFTRKRFRAQISVGNKNAGLRFMYCYRDLYCGRMRLEFDEGIGVQPDTRDNFCICGGYLLKVEKRVLTLSPLRLRTKIKLFFTFPLKSIKMYLEK